MSSFHERFWSKVNKTEHCWLWTAHKNRLGYGTYMVNSKRRSYLAHRFSWEINFGSIPNGLCVLHKCDVRSCVNPDHLFVGTQKDNILDMVNKKRNTHPRGEKNPKCKLSDDQIILIRKDLRKQSDIAKEFGVVQTTISKIKLRITWGHI